MKRRQRCTATVHTVRADKVNIRTRLQITMRSKPCIEKSSGCPRGIRRPSCSATSKGSRTKRRLGGSAAGSARSVRKCPARERLRRRLDRRGLAYPSGIVAAAIDSTRPSVLPNVLVGSTVKNVMSLSTGLAAGSVPVSIVSLSQGVLRSMLFAKIGLITAALLGLGVAATGVGVGVGVVGRTPQPAPPTARSRAPGAQSRTHRGRRRRSAPTEGRRRTRPRDGIDRPQRNELATDRHGDSRVSWGQRQQLPGRSDREPGRHAAAELARRDPALPGRERKGPLRAIQTVGTLGQPRQQGPAREDAQGVRVRGHERRREG